MDEEKLKKQVDALEQKLAQYETDGAIAGFYALNRIVNQQIKVLNSTNLASAIDEDPKESKRYDRTKAIWEGMAKMIADLNSLKAEFKITGDQDKDIKRIPFIESVATKRD